MSDKKLGLDKPDLDNESENDDHVQEPQESSHPTSDNPETFSYCDGQRTLTLTSKFFNTFDLMNMGANFLNLKTELKNKSPPSYLK